MKRIISAGLFFFLALFFTFAPSSHAALANNQQVAKILKVQPVMDQELIVGNLSELIPTKNEGDYQYYKFGSVGKYKVRILTKGDRTEVEIMDQNGEYKLAQIRFYNSGVSTNYKNGNISGYTRRLGNGIVAHYKNREAAESDKTGQKADFYATFTADGLYVCYCDTLENAKKGVSSLRVFSEGGVYEVETKKSGKWKLSMLISPEKGMIANYKDGRYDGMSMITQHGKTVSDNSNLPRL